MLFKQWVDQASGRCSYAIADEAAGACALVDPTSSLEPEYLDFARRHDLALHLVLETEPPPPAAASGDDWTEFMSRIGVDQHDPVEARTTRPLWERLGVPRVGPVTGWISPEDDGSVAPVLVQVDDSMLELRAPPNGRARREWFLFEAGPDAEVPMQLSYEGVRLVLGHEIIDCLATRGLSARVAFRWRDRLLQGGELRTGALDDPPPLPGWYRGLPEETLVYPRHSSMGVRVATIGQERTWSPGPTGVWQLPDLDAEEPDTEILELSPPAAAEAGELPEGTWNARGFPDLEPKEARAFLHRFRVVDLCDPARSSTRIPGARRLALQHLPEACEHWERSEPLLVVSESGVRCGTAVLMLQQLGFERVYRLLGGMELWEEHGFPVEPVLAERRENA